MPRGRHNGRLAILSDAIFPYHKGGKEERLRALTNLLVQTDAPDIHIYTMQWWDGPSVIQRDGLTLHAIMPKTALYTRTGRRSMWEAIRFSLATLKLLREDFDLLEVDHMPIIPLFTAKIVSLIKRTPLIGTWHEVWGWQTWREYLGPLGVIATALEWLSARLPNHIIAVSDHTATGLRSQLGYRGPLTVVKNGIDLAAFDAVPAAPHAKSDLIFVGRLIKHKNLDMLVSAVGLLVPHHPRITLTIIGDGPERANLEEQVALLGLSKHITFTGRVESDEAKTAIMKASQIFVTPSSREGFGISILEANACGLPVITANVAGNAGRHLITADNGQLANLSPEDLAAAITAQLARPAAKRRAAAHAAATRYDWRHALPELLKVYQP
ncbi:MAG TPA: glycosyltransferase family 4 protein [Candidatus Saccharimonadia bacterium]